jgi:hypothetical protein
MFDFKNVGVMECLGVLISIGVFVLIGIGKLDAAIGAGILTGIFTALGTFRRIEVGQQIKAAGIETIGKTPAPKEG